MIYTNNDGTFTNYTRSGRADFFRFTRYTFADGFIFSACEILGGYRLTPEAREIQEAKHGRIIKSVLMIYDITNGREREAFGF